MEFRAGANVVTSDGSKVGVLDRVVIDPKDRRVTHLIVQKGALFTTDRVVPVEMVSYAGENRVHLRHDAGDLEQLPEFEEVQYVPADEREWIREGDAGGRTAPDIPVAVQPTPTLYWYPPTGVGYPNYGAGAALPFRGQPGPAYAAETERNIPDETVPLKEGAKVTSADGEHVGDVERVLTDSASQTATHLVISQGVLFKHRKVVPMAWVLDVSEDNVRLAVGSELLQSLRDYQDEKRD
jgi:uncharacterized protein YrrD